MPAENRHYFDWAASAPPDYPRLAHSICGNPSSHHTEGRAAKQALEDARRRCAAVLNVPAESIYFTSGGTESNCIALYSNLFRRGQGRIISAETEHSSIRENIKNLEKLGRSTGGIAVDSSGRVSAALLENALEKYGDARFAAIMAVNNETGAITDMHSLQNVIRKYSKPPVHLHCDLVQAVGKIPVDISLWNIDSGSLSAHKIGGPLGIGLLYSRKPMEAIYSGGGQEGKIRPGTENTKGALALAACLESRAAGGVKTEYALAARRCKKLTACLKTLDRCTLIPADRNENDFSPYILQAAFRDIPGEVMVRSLDDLGFAVSAGSACSSSTAKRPVLAAMGVDEKTSLESIRISQGWTTTEEEIDLLFAAITEVLKYL
ncbi:MAG: cysteine desulfurase [Treponema sp.]|nr:cysteine desulfurase [Treponema sp.]